jgi:hypothetical protein
MPGSSSEMRQPLTEWIRSFQTLFGQQQQQLLLFGGHDNSTTTALPDDYLIQALRVASLLADKICRAEEAGQLPTPSSNWMDSIVVHLQSNNSDDGRFDLKTAEEDEDSIDVEKLFNSILSSDDGAATTCSSAERAGEDGEVGSNIRVEILPSLLFNATDGNHSRQATDEVLHSLGIVFYGIFSRGERPAELEHQQQEGGGT